MRLLHYQACSQALLKEASDRISNYRELARLAKSAPDDVDVVLRLGDERIGRFGGGVYGSSKDLEEYVDSKPSGKNLIIVSTTDPAILAHELGHADVDQSTIGRVLQSGVVRTGSNILPPAMALSVSRAAGQAMGPLAGALIGASVPFLVNSPVLIAEALASKKGVQRLREAGMSEKDIEKAKKQLWKAYGTYLAYPALFGAIGAGLGIASRA
jgi:hypothetical protein